MNGHIDEDNVCPRCTNATSRGLLVSDDCFVEDPGVWLHFIRCVNCGFRIERDSQALLVLL